MGVDLRAGDLASAYGRFAGEPSRVELERFFFLDDAARGLVEERRRESHRLGFAVQLTTVRFLGTFLAEPTDVPSNAVAYLAAQLGIRDVACLADYAARPTTAWEHAAEIRRIYGYRDFTDPAESFRLVRWLYTRAWLSSEQQRSRLQALHRLEHRVLDLRQAGSRMSLPPRYQLPCNRVARGLPARQHPLHVVLVGKPDAH
jgi:Domain of unknown function (DUF4158)